MKVKTKKKISRGLRLFTELFPQVLVIILLLLLLGAVVIG